MHTTLNPFYARRARRSAPTSQQPQRATDVKLPLAPITGSPVPHSTSLYHFDDDGKRRDRDYPGNCGGNLIKDLLRYFKPGSVFDPMTGSGSCARVCTDLAIYCYSSDLHLGIDACDATQFLRGCFEFCWVHPPYWRMQRYTDDPRDLSHAPTLAAFLERYRLLIENCAGAITPGGKVAILMGDYADREVGHVPLVFWTKYLAMKAGLRPCCPDIIRFDHGNRSSKKVHRSSVIPGLHDVCTIFEKA